MDDLEIMDLDSLEEELKDSSYKKTAAKKQKNALEGLEKLSMDSVETASDKRHRHKKARRRNRVKKHGALMIRDIVDYIVIFVVVVAFMYFVNTKLIVNANIPTSSMENTIMVNDRILGNRLAYTKGKNVHRYDIIIFKYPDDPSQLFIKRVIGLPGDTVTIIDGYVYLNDSTEPIPDTYIKEKATGTYGPFDVPSNSYFVMGDNRNDSLDSRFWVNTYVPKDYILGRAVFRIYPFNRIGKVE